MISLRKAAVTDVEILNRWDKEEHVLESDPDEDDWSWEAELAREPEWREQLMAEESGIPIGIIQIIDPAKEELHYWGDIEENKRAIDIWIGEKENLGKGYGTQMMTQALARCFQNKDVTEVLIDPLASNEKAIRFYRRMGFEFVERRTFGESDCEVYTICRERWEAIRVEAI